jgi:hypothetical protein
MVSARKTFTGPVNTIGELDAIDALPDIAQAP